MAACQSMSRKVETKENLLTATGFVPMGSTSSIARARMVSLATLCIAMSFYGAPARAASFDCARAALPAEKAICGNANLSHLDDSTAGMYLLIVGSGAPVATIEQVKQAQSRFIALRNTCAANIECLVDAYTGQMMYLRNVKGDLGL